MHDQDERLPLAHTPTLALARLTLLANVLGRPVLDHETLGPLVEVTDDPLWEDRDCPAGCEVVMTLNRTLVVLAENVLSPAELQEA